MNNTVVLEKYLAGELSKAEKTDLEKKLVENKNLQEELNLLKESFLFINLAGDLEMKQKFQAIASEVEKPIEKTPQPIFHKTKWAWGIAASVLVLFAAVFLWTSTKPSPSQLFANHFESYRAPIITRNSQANSNDLWTEAGIFYQNKNYEQAILSFDKIAKNQGSRAYLAHFYLGMIYLSKENAESEKAIHHFKTVLKSKNDYHQQSNWYLALAYLKMEKTELAKNIFETISQDPNHYKQKTAQEILSRL